MQELGVDRRITLEWIINKQAATYTLDIEDSEQGQWLDCHEHGNENSTVTVDAEKYTIFLLLSLLYQLAGHQNALVTELATLPSIARRLKRRWPTDLLRDPMNN
jgi:hypothetical protein